MAEAYKPKTPYKGSLPSGTVKKGSKGPDVRAVQKFLNWSIKAGLGVDGNCGAKTAAAIKKFQRRYKLLEDGVFGPACKKKAQAIIKKYNTASNSKAKSKTTPTVKSPQKEMLAWAKKIAKDDTYHYVFYNSGKLAHECPICHKHAKGKYHGWNCIGFAWGSWHHGGGLKTRCSCDVINNAQYEKILYSSKETALKLAQQRVGTKKLKVIRNRSGLSIDKLKPGDVIAYFNGSKYVHTALYIGDGKIADCTSGRKDQIKYGVKSYSSMKIKLAFRYTGE